MQQSTPASDGCTQYSLQIICCHTFLMGQQWARHCTRYAEADLFFFFFSNQPVSGLNLLHQHHHEVKVTFTFKPLMNVCLFVCNLSSHSSHYPCYLFMHQLIWNQTNNAMSFQINHPHDWSMRFWACHSTIDVFLGNYCSIVPSLLHKYTNYL